MNKISITLLVLCFATLFSLKILMAEDSAKTGAMETLKGKRIVMIIATANFQEDELYVPFGYLKTKGADVQIASGDKSIAKGMSGTQVVPDLKYTDISSEKFDAIIFIGGTGSKQYWPDTAAHKIAADALANGKVLAAICFAPGTLANSGVLNGKKATAWPSPETEKLFKEKNVVYTGADVEIDGKIITANGPKSAYKFVKEIEKALLNQ